MTSSELELLQYLEASNPTLILFVDGEPVKRIVGFTPRERIEARLWPYLAGGMV